MKSNQVVIKIPEKLKSELLIMLDTKPPSFPYNIDGFLYIVSKIVQIPMYNRKYEKLNKIPLYSRILRREIGKHYKRYLEYLIDNGYMETDNHYIVSSPESEGKCKCYSITKKYKKSKLVNHKLTKNTIINKVLAWRKEFLGKTINDEMLGKLYDMLKTFSIDIDSATSYMQDLVDKGQIKQQHMDLELEKCTRINSKEESDLAIFISKDSYNRVHSNFTNLSKHIRENFLYVNGKKAIGVDIVSSQASMLYTLMVNYVDDLEAHMAKNMFELLDMNTSHPRVDVRSKYVNSKNSYSGAHIYDGRFNTSIPIIDGKSLPVIIDSARNELRIFKRILNTEGIYEFFQNKWELLHQEDKSRSYIKKQWITYVFGKGHGKAVEKIDFVWKITFPIITALMNHLKRGDYKAMAHKLQRTEAELLFNKVCPRIDSEFNVPYCTVHDSVIVAEDQVDDIAFLFEQILDENGVSSGVTY